MAVWGASVALIGKPSLKDDGQHLAVLSCRESLATVPAVLGNPRDLQLLASICEQQAERFPEGNSAGVVGIGYGWIARGGVWTAEFGIVYLSAPGFPGVPDESLEARGHEVPCCCFPIDLFVGVPTPPETAARAPLRVGSPILAGDLAGGIGGLVSRTAICAGHVFPGGTGSFSFAGGRVGRCLGVAPTVDAALLRIDATVAVRSATPDGLQVAGLRPVTEGDFDRPAFVYSPRRGRTLKPYLVAANMRMYFRERGQLFGMLMTESCTVPGDSGTALLGTDGAVLGVLSFGGPQFSFFTSITAIRQVTGWI